jgi:hypothetical protein
VCGARGGCAGRLDDPASSSADQECGGLHQAGACLVAAAVGRRVRSCLRASRLRQALTAAGLRLMQPRRRCCRRVVAVCPGGVCLFAGAARGHKATKLPGDRSRQPLLPAQVSRGFVVAVWLQTQRSFMARLFCALALCRVGCVCSDAVLRLRLLRPPPALAPPGGGRCVLLWRGRERAHVWLPLSPIASSKAASRHSVVHQRQSASHASNPRHALRVSCA